MMGLLTIITMMCRPPEWPGIAAESFIFNPKTVLLTQRLSTVVANGFYAYPVLAVYRATLSTFPGHNQPSVAEWFTVSVSSGAGLRGDGDLSLDIRFELEIEILGQSSIDQPLG